MVLDEKCHHKSWQFGGLNFGVNGSAVPPNSALETSANEALPDKPETVALVPENPEAVAPVPELLVTGILDTSNAARINKNPPLTKPKLTITHSKEAFDTLWQKLDPEK